jgi:hypothetical protein
MGRWHDYAWCWADPHQLISLNVKLYKNTKKNSMVKEAKVVDHWRSELK